MNDRDGEVNEGIGGEQEYIVNEVCAKCAKKGFTKKHPYPIECKGMCRKKLPKASFGGANFSRDLKKGTLKCNRCQGM